VNRKVLLAKAEKLFCRLMGTKIYRVVRSLLDGKTRKSFDELAMLRKLLCENTRNGFMLDVGAHNGESFCLFAYEGWDVFAFEPDPSELKHAMIQARATPRVKIFRHPLSNVSGEEISFYVSAESTGVSSMSPFLESHKPIDEKLMTSTLSDVLLRENNQRPPDLLKIDTEGHDLFVLQGVDWASCEQIPRAVLCEFEDKKTTPLGYSFRDLGDLLLERGYAVFLSEWFPVKQYGGAHEWRSLQAYPCELTDPQAWGNFIAVDKSLADQAKNLLSPHLAEASGN